MSEQLPISQITAQETWPVRHQVMWPDRPWSYVQLTDDDTGVHFGLWKDRQLIAVVSVFINQNIAQFRKLATLEAEQGKGYGSFLLKHLMDYLLEKKVVKVWCNARAHKTAFYKKFGMTETTNTFSKGGMAYVVMEKWLIN